MSEGILFSRLLKFSSVVPVFKNVGERSTAKNYCPVSLLSVVSKVFEELVNKRLVDHLERCGLLSDFQYGFRSSRSTADLLTVVSVKLLGLLIGLKLLELQLLISKAFYRVWRAGLLHKLLSLMQYQVRLILMLEKPRLSFFFPKLLFIPINRLYGLTWNTAVVPELILLAATWVLHFDFAFCI